jgi:heme/copper-type cytochrome/quinol oxidase subunit 4
MKTPGTNTILNFIYGIVLIIAAIVIILQHENLLNVNIYIIYIFAGILLGLGIITFLNLFSK